MRMFSAPGRPRLESSNPSEGDESGMKREIIIGYDPDHAADDALQLGRVLSEVLAAKPRVIAVVPWPEDRKSVV